MLVYYKYYVCSAKKNANNMKFAIGKKLGMTTVYTDDGAQNVTLVSVEDNAVDLVRSQDKDGYTAVRVKAPKTTKKDVHREFRINPSEDVKIGHAITVEAFEVGEKVSVSALTKGKGFQGVVKRHNFKGGPASHGHRHVLRQPGSIGSAFPQHVLKGKRMAGRVKAARATNKGLKIVKIDVENNILAIKGSVPGVAGRIVEIAAT